LFDVAKEEQIWGGKKTLEYLLHINNYNGNELRHNGVAKHNSDDVIGGFRIIQFCDLSIINKV
jgi:hypothetical protein